MTDAKSVAPETPAEPDAAGQRLFFVALIVFSASVVGFILAFIFNWPSDFVIGEVADSEVTLADIVTGTVASAPLAPMVVLFVAALFVRSRRWWGTVAAVVLTLLGALFMIGGLGELTSDNENVPKPVLVIAGLIVMVLGLSLLVTGVRDLMKRSRT